MEATTLIGTNMAPIGSAATDPTDPSLESADRIAMAEDWTRIEDILIGAKAIRRRRQIYLPQRPKESDAAYSVRLAHAPWRNEFEDAIRALCAKPFTQEVVVNQDAPDDIQGKMDTVTKKRSGGLVDDVDGQGNSLHVFARDVFWNGLSYGLDAIYVTYPNTDAQTRAQEKEQGVRPYWVHIRGRQIIDCTFRMVAGRQVVEHIRWHEVTLERNGFASIVVQRVRVLELDEAGDPTWTLYRKNPRGKYDVENSGYLTNQKQIPVALFYTGTRFGSWGVMPPFNNLAEMQLELFRAASGTERIMTLANAPMLVGAGFEAPRPTPIINEHNEITGETPAPQIEVGPGVVLFAPAMAEGVQPSWQYIAPQAANVQQSREYSDGITLDFRRLALQPTTPQSGNMVATGQAIDAAKSHSAVEVWANGLKDALDLAWTFTTQWLNMSDTISTTVNTDFGIDLQGEAELSYLGSMQTRGVISKQTEREEASRRGVLGPNFDEDEENGRIAEEMQGLEPEIAIDPVTGEYIEPSTRPRNVSAPPAKLGPDGKPLPPPASNKQTPPARANGGPPAKAGA